jgi:hypothetical protein
MFSTGFGAFGTPGSLTTTIIGNAVIDDITTDLGAEALALAQSNFANKAEKSALALKADESALNTLTTTVNGKAAQTLVQEIQTAIGFDTMPASMKGLSNPWSDWIEQNCWRMNFHAMMQRCERHLSSSGKANSRSIGLYLLMWKRCERIGVKAFLIWGHVARWSKVSLDRPHRRHR